MYVHLGRKIQGFVYEKLVIKFLCFIKQQITKHLLKHRSQLHVISTLQ